MPGSVNVQESPQILKYVFSVIFLVLSLMLTAFGFANNAWIVLGRENDEFQRGVRGLDCFKVFKPIENISCLPWGSENKSAKFPEPFTQVLDVSIFVQIEYYLAWIIIISQFFWLSYTVGVCCSAKCCERVVIHKLALFHAMITTVGFWIVLAIFFMIEKVTGEILPESLRNPEWSYGIGSGFWIFFLGGMLPFIGALFCLFGDQVQKSQQRLRGLIGKHEHIELNQHEPNGL